MTALHDVRFPGENEDYRQARDALLREELKLRDQTERVAAMRRALPTGGKVPRDYVFDEMSPTGAAGQTRLADLFRPGKPTLLVYSLMYGTEATAPCPMCTAFLDGLNGNAPHILDRVNLAVVARAPAATLRALADRRGWTHLRLLSSQNNDYNVDYHSELPGGDQWPIMHVFHQADGAIYHRYASEVFYDTGERDHDPRHMDPMWSLWNILDLTPEGRGDWYPHLDDT